MPEQTLGWLPLGLGLVEEDEPSELSCIIMQVTANIEYGSGLQHAVGVWERSFTRQNFIYNLTYGDGKIVLTLGRYDESIRTIYFIQMYVIRLAILIHIKY